ncbi:IclR family transcriptional regulator [Natrinema halophilum]|uniref:IclR family transcriptional regulator n=1 Tax=Natrinema halophilum TaxID=1699371 RepID=A0A7D5GIV7_9EURY|nr:IclR family transcriptional regulator [Natrinema halophilum]QLG50188.1 IclR family transcriptional regulator [Natrinema halophilum]
MTTEQGDTEADSIGVSTTRKTFALLEALKETEGVTIADLTQRTDLPKSTVYRHLQTLTEVGYVIERDGRYYVGFRFVELGEQARSRRMGYTAAKRAVFELGQETDELAVFVVEEDNEAVYVHRYGSLSNTMIGQRRPLHSMASGKVILAEWDDESVHEYVRDVGLEALSPNTITDSDALFDELESIREQGYAVNDQELMDGLRGVAVPVYTPDGDFLGGLAAFGPTSRLTDAHVHDDLLTRLRDKAGEIKVTLAYS